MTCSRRRVFHLVESLNLKDGGPSKSVSALFEARINAGFTDLLATVYCSQDQINQAYAKYSYPAYFGKSRFSPSLMYQLYKSRRRYDIIHVNCIWNFVFIFGLLAAFFFRKKIILSTRGMLRIEHIRASKLKIFIFYYFLRTLLKKFDMFHVTSEWEKQDLIKLGINEKNICFIYNLNNVACKNFYSENKHRTRSNFIYLYVGRIHPYKRVLELIDAFVSLPKASLNCSTLQIIGPHSDVEYSQLVKKKIKTAPNEAKILIYDFKEGPELQKFYDMSDVLVMPSKSENFGMSILEALRSDMLVVVPELSPWPEILPEEFREVVSMDALNLRDCLIQAKRKAKSTKEKQLRLKAIIKQFNEDEILKQFISIYQVI